MTGKSGGKFSLKFMVGGLGLKAFDHVGGQIIQIDITHIKPHPLRLQFTGSKQIFDQCGQTIRFIFNHLSDCHG